VGSEYSLFIMKALLWHRAQSEVCFQKAVGAACAPT